MRGYNYTASEVNPHGIKKVTIRQHAANVGWLLFVGGLMGAILGAGILAGMR